jgi:hypothetical protein
MILKDSEHIIVLDDKMKVKTIEGLFLRLLGLIILAGLTVYGLIGGVTSKFMLAKMQSIDAWTEQPGNAVMLFYTGVGLVSIVLLTCALWALVFRNK